MIANHSSGPRNNVREANHSVSVTIPDKTLSLRDLITRHMSGGRVKSFSPQFLGDSSVVPNNFERLDLLERAQMAKDLPLFIADSRGRLQTARRVRYLAHLREVALAEAKPDVVPSPAQAEGNSPS